MLFTRDFMSEPKHISAVICRLFSRADLPARVLDGSNFNVLVWSDDDLAYKAPGQLFVWPSFIRSQWGTRFREATPAIEQELACAR